MGGTLAELGRLRLQEGDLAAALANSWQALSIFHGTSRPEAAYAAITILGLAAAFAAAILIGQFVRNELTYDHWIPGYTRVYNLGAFKDWAEAGGAVEQPGAPA